MSAEYSIEIVRDSVKSYFCSWRVDAAESCPELDRGVPLEGKEPIPNIEEQRHKK